SKGSNYCAPYMLTATSMDQFTGQMTFYQDQSGSMWLTGLYQNGFSKGGYYSFSIMDGCNNYLYNLTDKLGLEPSQCDSCADKSSHSSYQRRMGRRNMGNNCDMGFKPWVIKIHDLTWDCDGRGVYNQRCKKDDEKKDEKRALTDQGPQSGLFLQIDTSSGSGSAPINVNNAGG
ncbi:14282_t:CDS:1, partial [Dentiscutata heterogama]